MQIRAEVNAILELVAARTPIKEIKKKHKRFYIDYPTFFKMITQEGNQQQDMIEMMISCKERLDSNRITSENATAEINSALNKKYIEPVLEKTKPC